jgi:anti-sigma factor RsiW
MHEIVRRHLEDFLRTGSRNIPAEFDAHLRDCAACRESVSWMLDHSRTIRAMAPPESLEPAPGFYGRLIERIEARASASIWSVFLDPVFDRRLVAASAMFACLFAGYLAFTETHPEQQVDNAAAVMAVQEHPDDLGADQQRDRDTILVTLATYKEFGQ